MRRSIGVNSWVWESPSTNDSLPGLVAKIAALGFQAIELPVENPGDWDPAATASLLHDHQLDPTVVGAMGAGRTLVDRGGDTAATQDYLRHCIDAAVELGASVVAGPFYAPTGLSWRMALEERAATVATLRRNLLPVADYAGERNIRIAIEPLNRYETSLINTVEQALDALEPLLGPALGLALDSYHLAIEEKDPGDAIRLAGENLVHVQVCGSDRGAVGDDHSDWPGFLDALDEVGYTGPLNLESFTGENETIAVAASIWRPLAASQDELAERSIRFLTALQEDRAARAVAFERTHPEQHAAEQPAVTKERS